MKLRSYIIMRVFYLRERGCEYVWLNDVAVSENFLDEVTPLPTFPSACGGEFSKLAWRERATLVMTKS